MWNSPQLPTNLRFTEDTQTMCSLWVRLYIACLINSTLDQDLTMYCTFNLDQDSTMHTHIQFVSGPNNVFSITVGQGLYFMPNPFSLDKALLIPDPFN